MFSKSIYCIYSNNCPGALQFTRPVTDVLETKCRQLYTKQISILKAMLGDIWPSFSNKRWGEAFIRMGVFIRINMVNTSHLESRPQLTTPGLPDGG